MLDKITNTSIFNNNIINIDTLNSSTFNRIDFYLNIQSNIILLYFQD